MVGKEDAITAFGAPGTETYAVIFAFRHNVHVDLYLISRGVFHSRQCSTNLSQPRITQDTTRNLVSGNEFADW